MIYVTIAVLVVAWMFILFGMVAIFRLQNIYTRILTSTTIDTVASLLILFSLLFVVDSLNFLIRLLLLIGFLLITNPISSHVNIRSAYLSGIPIETKGEDYD